MSSSKITLSAKRKAGIKATSLVLANPSATTFKSHWPKSVRKRTGLCIKLEFYNQGQAFNQVVHAVEDACISQESTCYPPSSYIQLPSDANLGKQWPRLKIKGFLPPRWGTCIAPWALGYSPPQSWELSASLCLLASEITNLQNHRKIAQRFTGEQFLLPFLAV